MPFNVQTFRMKTPHRVIIALLIQAQSRGGKSKVEEKTPNVQPLPFFKALYCLGKRRLQRIFLRKRKYCQTHCYGTAISNMCEIFIGNSSHSSFQSNLLMENGKFRYVRPPSLSPSISAAEGMVTMARTLFHKFPQK